MKPTWYRRRWFLVLVAVGTSLILLNLVFTYIYDMHHLDAKAVEREFRSALPPGSSISMVEQALGKHNMEVISNPPSNTLSTVLRDVRGSSLIIREDVLFTFHFEDAAKLQSIETEMYLTGP